VRRLDGKGSIGERDDWSSRSSEQEVDEVTRTEVRFAFYQYRLSRIKSFKIKVELHKVTEKYEVLSAR
jgi:hypothetical protein